MGFQVVLHHPEQPGNTGAIGRTCICAGAGLHLIRPLGFRTDEKSVRRAGLDYWPRIWYFTTKARHTIDQGDYRDGDFLLFGAESAGIPEEILAAHPEQCLRIPMREGERSLNLSNAVAVALYEALRHTGYAGLEKYGRLHHGSWEENDRIRENR